MIGDRCPKVVKTAWGTTDDVITLPNKKKYYFFKIPHKVKRGTFASLSFPLSFSTLYQDGNSANCGNLFSKDYLPKMEDGTLTAADQLGQEILKYNSKLSYWRSTRNRVM